MMGTHSEQGSLFQYEVNLDQRVRRDHPLRAVHEAIDFTFVRAEVAHLYGRRGNESVDPVVILKLMFLLFLDNVASERELMQVVPERLDYLWFLGYGLDEPIPNHSVLSKARKRWGAEAFETFFALVVAQCVQSGLVSGDKIHVDSSLIRANASKNSIIQGSTALIEALRKSLQGELAKLDEPLAPAEDTVAPSPQDESSAPSAPDTALPNGPAAKSGLISTTDPDAAVVSRRGQGTAPRYKNHRAVDDQCGVITACVTTAGDVDDGHTLRTLVDAHEQSTSQNVQTCVGDSGYGTIENYRMMHARGITAHTADHQKTNGIPSQEKVLPVSKFTYDAQSDTFTCPEGHVLRNVYFDRTLNRCTYQAPKSACTHCPLRSQCTTSTKGHPRRVKRNVDQSMLDATRRKTQTNKAKRDRIRRRYLMEGSFADAANNHGFKRSRWRGLVTQKIQNFIIAAVQNIRILLRKPARPPKAMAAQNGLDTCRQDWPQSVRSTRINALWRLDSLLQVAQAVLLASQRWRLQSKSHHQTRLLGNTP